MIHASTKTQRRFLAFWAMVSEGHKKKNIDDLLLEVKKHPMWFPNSTRGAAGSRTEGAGHILEWCTVNEEGSWGFGSWGMLNEKMRPG